MKLAKINRKSKVLLSVSALSLSAIVTSQAAVVVAGTNLVNLRADDASAATANWNNTGSLGGTFAKTGTAPVSTIGGVQYVSYADAGAYHTGATAPVAITGAGNRSIEVWTRNANVTVEENLFGWGARWGPDGTNMSFNYGTSGTFGAGGLWGGADIGWDGTPSAGDLHYLVFTYDGTNVTVFSDGVQKNTKTFTLNTKDPFAFRVHAQNGGDGTFDPKGDGLDIAVVRVSDGVLNQAQITNNFNEGVTGAIPEPASSGLALLGILGLLARRKRE